MKDYSFRELRGVVLSSPKVCIANEQVLRTCDCWDTGLQFLCCSHSQ